MRRPLLTVAAAALVAGAACSHEDPCAFGASGAPWLAFGSDESGSWDVQLVRLDGTCRHALTTGPAADLDPAWGPASLLAYDSDRAPFPSIWIRDLRLGLERRLDVGDLYATSPALSPDGRTLAFEGRAAGATTGAIYTVPIAGGAPTLLTPEVVQHGNGGPVFSPDGATVYFVSNRTGYYDVWSVPAGGGTAVRVTTNAWIVGKPAISPDGKTLAFARAGATTDVVLYDLATGTTTPLVSNTSEPAFDPAGGLLAVRLLTGGTANIALVPLDGSAPLALTTGKGPDGVPAFAPRG